MWHLQSKSFVSVMDNVTVSGSIEELKEESVGLILLIIWKVTVMCQVRLHWKHERLEKLVESERLQRLGHPHLSSPSLILTVEQYG